MDGSVPVLAGMPMLFASQAGHSPVAAFQLPPASLSLQQKDGGACGSRSLAVDAGVKTASHGIRLAAAGGTVTAAALVGVASRRLGRRRRQRGHGVKVALGAAEVLTATQESRVAMAASAAEAMEQMLQKEVPAFLEVARVRESAEEGAGLGLFAAKAFEEDTDIFRWEAGSDAMMIPDDDLADKLELGYIGALAFQVLREVRTPEEERSTPFGDWVEAGASAPKTHPLKMVLSHPDAVQRLWNCTTCGGGMSGQALQMKEDHDLLQGSASIEEWAEVIALVQSRTICEDDEKRPLLCLGLDLIQDGDSYNCEIEVRYETLGGGLFGIGGKEVRRFKEVALVATRELDEGEELKCRYLPTPHGGKYIERYGFLPNRLRGKVGMIEACAELTFEPTNEDEDDFFGVKLEALENEGIPEDTMAFVIDSQMASTGVINWDWEGADFKKLSSMEKMVVILRLRHMGGKDAFLLDATYADAAWSNCFSPISRDNDLLVCQSVTDECDRWLERFQETQTTTTPRTGDADCDNLLAAAADLQAAEVNVLVSLKDMFALESRQVTLAVDRTYWADKQMQVLFPQKKTFKTVAALIDPGERISVAARKPTSDAER